MTRADFLEPAGRPDKLDIVVMRRAILRELTLRLPEFEGTLLDVGCGDMPYRPLLTAPPSRVTRYFGLDFEHRPASGDRPDLTWQDGRIPLPDNSVNCAISTEVLEHCPDPVQLLREIHRVLKPEGLLFFTTPFLWPLHEQPADYQRLTPYGLDRHLRHSGFHDIRIAATGGWDASLALMLGLWVRRRPMRRWIRALLSLFALPAVAWLMRTDRRDDGAGRSTWMIIGTAGTARKAGADG